VVFCHGADSHDQDDFGGVCSTAQWQLCSKIVYKFINDIEEELGESFPISLALFGGYREDHYDSVLGLHATDLVECLNMMCGHKIKYKPEIKTNAKFERLRNRKP
jgi:hypothetical protein